MHFHKPCYICKEKCDNEYLKDKIYRKVRDHCLYAGKYRGTTHSICNLKDSVPEKIPIVFHNGSNYDYHFIMKELAEESKKQFTCLGENSKKYITFTVLIEKKVTRIDKNGKKYTKNISYKLQFTDSARFMASSLSNLVNNISERIHIIKCKHGHDDKKCEACGMKHKYCNCFVEYINFKDDLIENKCLICNKKYQRKFDEKLKERFFNNYKFLTTIIISLFNCCEKLFILLIKEK